MTIKNIVFDVGNVLLRWDPLSIITLNFPERNDHLVLVQKIFKSNVWENLNLGKISENEAIEQYFYILNIDREKLRGLMRAAKESQLPIDGSIELLKNLHKAQFPLYALTDNVKEIVAYLKEKYDFWSLLQGMVVSAEIGFIKPSPHIYHYLLNTYQLNATETLFIDDHLPNVKGAKNVGMKAIQFINTPLCLGELEKVGIKLQ